MTTATVDEFAVGAELQRKLDRLNAPTWATKHAGHEIIIVKTRTGNKLHLGSAGGSGTNCGVWLKANGVHFKVNAARVTRAHVLCEKCFGADPLSKREG